MTDDLQLRPATAADLPIFFEQQLNPAAIHMAAFTVKDPADRAAFMAKWTRLLADDTITLDAILLDGRVAGSISVYTDDVGQTEVTYWIGREFWGQGVATWALAEFLNRITTRPIYARVAKDNVASHRVLEKCGFAVYGEDKGYANARGEEIEEYLLVLRSDPASGRDAAPDG